MHPQTATRAEAYLAFGANEGDPVAQIAAAVRGLAAVVEWTALSSVYRSEPVGYADQPDYYNLVGYGHTMATAATLLAAAHSEERRLGRRRTHSNAPRTIDIDLLAYDDVVTQLPDLILPHPRMHLRRFVLAPLAEIAPSWRHPVLDRTAADLLDAAGELEGVELWGRL